MRALIFVIALVLLPLAAYWQTATYEYGFRDDYAHLREVREEPGKLVKFTSSNGRPMYGMLLEQSLQHVRTVPDLAWLRLASVGLLSLVGIALWAFLRRSGWGEVEAAAVGVGTALLPGAQVIVGWAIAWPIAVGLLAAVLGFWFVERHLERRGAGRADRARHGRGALFARRSHVSDERVVRRRAARGGVAVARGPPSHRSCPLDRPACRHSVREPARRVPGHGCATSRKAWCRKLHACTSSRTRC